MSNVADLSGWRILVAEDDFYLANDAERVLRAAGARVVGPAPRSPEALEALGREAIDAAVVDINLGDGPTFELADALMAAGVPFVFVTGYDEVQIPARLAGVEILQKPTGMQRAAEVLAALLNRES